MQNHVYYCLELVNLSILDFIQVRDQAKINASKVREAVKEEKAHQVSILAAEIKVRGVVNESFFFFISLCLFQAYLMKCNSEILYCFTTREHTRVFGLLKSDYHKNLTISLMGPAIFLYDAIRMNGSWRSLKNFGS